MNVTLEDFVHNQNIKNYQARLKREPLGTATDEAQRKMVLRLLAEEKLKDEKSLPAG
jgi:hypothetical protein